MTVIIIDVVAAAAQLLRRITEVHKIELSAPVTCPSCGREVRARWLADQTTAAQQCGACGHVFTASWPGFDFAPRTVVITAPSSLSSAPG